MIAADEAYLWYVRPERLDARGLQFCRTLVTRSERERARAMRRPAAERTWLVARALVRFVLAVHTGIAPRALRFRRERHGKPALAGPDAGGLSFSLSHTEGLVACLVARVEAGVDVERLRRPVSVMSVARRFFTTAEVRDLRAFPRVYRRQRFLQLWTLKEAYLKARGVGLAGGLDSLSVFISGGDPVETRMTDDDPDVWQLGLPDISNDHVAAYALRGTGVRVVSCPADRVMR
jgi:4'-phosphopantetheinyl transferase